jgi:hypothetical protein
MGRAELKTAEPREEVVVEYEGDLFAAERWPR